MSELRKVVLSTKNPGKVAEIRRVMAELPLEIVSLEEFAGIDEPEETGRTFRENARDKAMYYSHRTGHWCLADDSGLVVDALGGAPGVLSARYAADECEPGADRDTIDQANNAKLLRELTNIPEWQRAARFVCHLVLADGEKVLIETSGRVEGVIARTAAGENGFGYDPLFYLPDRGCTTAELSTQDKNAISHRGKASRQMAEMLRQMLGR